MSPGDRDAPLLEQATTAWRPRDPDGRARPHPAWLDLDEADRRLAFDETLRARSIEQALDPEGLSSTARAVLARLRAASEG